MRLQLRRISRAGKERAIQQATESQLKTACAAAYEHPAVRWLLGDQLHPGGEATTARALELIDLKPEERLLDVASGKGDSALLAARAFGCRVSGIDFSQNASNEAQGRAREHGLGERVHFVSGDAEELPFEDGCFDAVLCECSLCTFPNKPRALSEMRRVLARGGRLALCDVVVEEQRLPAALREPMATVACVGDALSQAGYAEALVQAGFRLLACEDHAPSAAALAEHVEDRLRGARMIGFADESELPVSFDYALELVGLGGAAIADGALGYTIFAAART